MLKLVFGIGHNFQDQSLVYLSDRLLTKIKAVGVLLP